MVQWWMAHYSSATPKRHYAYGNSEEILRFDKGRLEGWKGDPAARRRQLTVIVIQQEPFDTRGIETYVGQSSRLAFGVSSARHSLLKGISRFHRAAPFLAFNLNTLTQTTLPIVDDLSVCRGCIQSHLLG